MRLPGLILTLCLAPAVAVLAQTATDTTSSTTAAKAPVTTSQLLSLGQRAYMAGNIDVATEKFKAVLAADPDNYQAKTYLKMIAASDNKTGKSELAKKLGTLTLEKITFKDASLDSVLAYLKDQADKLSGGQIKPSFVLQLPADYATQNTVTLELEKVPFTEVLRYIGDLTATKFSIEEYAIVVKKA